MIRRAVYNAHHAQEEAFYRDVDNLLIGRMQVQADSEEAKRALAKVAKLKDAKLIDQLARLGVTPEALLVMQMVPIVLIAWANHGVDDRERQYVLAQARRFGISERSEADAMLEHWLDHRPPVLVFDAWRRFMRHELSSMSLRTRERLVSMMKEQMTGVARCSGGFLGFRRVSTNEQKLIQAINKVLDDCLSIAAAAFRAG